MWKEILPDDDVRLLHTLNLFEKVMNYVIEHEINPYTLMSTFIIATSHVLRKYKIPRSEIDKIVKNVGNIWEIFPDGFSDMEEIDAYLHGETKDIIQKSLDLVISGNTPNEMSHYNNKDNVASTILGVFMDYLIYGNAHSDIWNEIDNLLGEIFQ